MSETGDAAGAELPSSTTLRVRRALEGDPGSLAWVVEHFTPLLLAHARYRLARHLSRLYEPEDLVQQVWFVCLPRLGDIRPRDGRYTPVLLTFLGTTLLRHYGHLVERMLRENPRRPLREEGPVAPEEIPAAITGVVSRAVRGEIAQRVHAGIAAVGPADREILILRGIEQLSYGDIARKLDVTPPSLRVRYHRALRRLRETLPAGMADELAAAD